MDEDHFKLRPGEDIRSMSYQTRVRATGARSRFDYVVGAAPMMLSGKGKYYLLNHVGLKEAYEAARASCPIAADAILVLLWDDVHQIQTLEVLARDYENQDR